MLRKATSERCSLLRHWIGLLGALKVLACTISVELYSRQRIRNGVITKARQKRQQANGCLSRTRWAEQCWVYNWHSGFRLDTTIHMSVLDHVEEPRHWREAEGKNLRPTCGTQDKGAHNWTSLREKTHSSKRGIQKVKTSIVYIHVSIYTWGLRKNTLPGADWPVLLAASTETIWEGTWEIPQGLKWPVWKT